MSAGERITPAEWRRLTGKGAASRVASVGARSQEIGARAEQDFIASCELLEMQRRVWWQRIPDPLIPHGAPTPSGELLCRPRERERGTDFMGALLGEEGGGITWGVEVKGTEGGDWRASASLRPAQVRALLGLAAAGLPCGVYLVHYGARTSRFWLPWVGDALAVARLDLRCGAPDGDAYRVGAQETWLDVLARLRK